MFKFYILLVCIYLSSSTLILSQRKFKQENQVDGFSIAPSLGIASVVGELGDLFSFKSVYGIDFDKGISEKVNLGIAIIGGNLQGAENEPYYSKFKTDYFQIQSVGILNVSRYFITSYNKNDFEIKLYGGFGLIWFHTDVFNLKNGLFIRATSENASKHTTLFQPTGIGIGDPGIFYTRELVVPFGCNINYKLKDDVSVNFGLGYNWINNDKLDGTTPYNIMNPNVIAGINSYSNTMNDGWVSLLIGLKYTFSFKRGFIPRGV